MHICGPPAVPGEFSRIFFVDARPGRLRTHGLTVPVETLLSGLTCLMEDDYMSLGSLSIR